MRQAPGANLPNAKLSCARISGAENLQSFLRPEMLPLPLADHLRATGMTWVNRDTSRAGLLSGGIMCRVTTPMHYTSLGRPRQMLPCHTTGSGRLPQHQACLPACLLGEAGQWQAVGVSRRFGRKQTSLWGRFRTASLRRLNGQAWASKAHVAPCGAWIGAKAGLSCGLAPTANIFGPFGAREFQASRQGRGNPRRRFGAGEVRAPLQPGGAP